MQFTVTFFQTFGAGNKTEEKGTLAELAKYIQTTHAPAKDKLPWLKLAAFGDKRTNKGSLRHDANVRWVSGIEADYDGGQMPFDEAVGILRIPLHYGLGLHQPVAPGSKTALACPVSVLPWENARQTLPLPCPPQWRLRWSFSQESWTLSQAYHFGAIDGNPPLRVAQIYGHTIDQLDDLDASAIGRPAGPRKAASDTASNDQEPTPEMTAS